jgi:hypothetical protein
MRSGEAVDAGAFGQGDLTASPVLFFFYEKGKNEVDLMKRVSILLK